MSRLALCAIIIGGVLHALCLFGWQGNSGLSVLSLPGSIAVELLALGSLAIFLGMRRWSGDERRIATVSIFVSSLVLALSAPAAFLPLAGERLELWATWGSDALPSFGVVPFVLWATSFLIGGLAMHLLITQRWRALPQG